MHVTLTTPSAQAPLLGAPWVTVEKEKEEEPMSPVFIQRSMWPQQEINSSKKPTVAGPVHHSSGSGRYRKMVHIHSMRGRVRRPLSDLRRNRSARGLFLRHLIDRLWGSYLLIPSSSSPPPPMELISIWWGEDSSSVFSVGANEIEIS